MKTKEQILKSHCPSMDDLFLDEQGKLFRERVFTAMNEYAIEVAKASLEKYAERYVIDKSSLDNEDKYSTMSNTSEDKYKADITVVSIPSHISLECPYCKNDLEIKYRDFCDMSGEPCDWTYSSFECPECERSIEIDGVDWN